MNLILRHKLDIITVILFTGLIFHCLQNPDTPGWIVLFLLIIINALLSVFKKPVAMISWFAIMIGILGVVMSLPTVVESGLAYAKGIAAVDKIGIDKWHPVMYFMITILFGFVQLHQLLIPPRHA